MIVILTNTLILQGQEYKGQYVSGTCKEDFRYAYTYSIDSGELRGEVTVVSERQNLAGGSVWSFGLTINVLMPSFSRKSSHSVFAPHIPLIRFCTVSVSEGGICKVRTCLVNPHVRPSFNLGTFLVHSI